jgi:GH15 family glucan-1,4-alpha-glucosidase
VGILYRIGEALEGEEYMKWLVAQCSVGVRQMQILYGIAEESILDEYELSHLEGYRQSPPVRIGNGAAFHRQLDVFGEVVFSIATYHKHVGPIPGDWWDLVEIMAEVAAQSWRLPDNGMWEVRGPQQHFVSSKLMCWLALDRAASLGESLGRTERVDEWRRAAQEVHADIMANGWSEKKQSFVQRYGSDNLDASVLLVPFTGFLPADDPRVVSTVRAIQRELAKGPFIHRYRTEETDDGFQEGEGCFFMLSFWLAGALAMIGARQEALEVCEQVVAKASPLGLFAEMWDPVGNQALGNFPQALSHIGFLHTARNLSNVFDRQDDLLG